MKINKFVLAIIFSILTLGSIQYNSVYAEKEEIEETIDEQVPQIKRSSVTLGESTLQENVESYLKATYGTQNWYRKEYNTTEKVLNVKPIEMQDENLYEKAVIEGICKELGLKSTYGGCGPIAMIGMADFFARCFGYDEIIKNPNDLEQQKQLIREFLNPRIISTIEVNDPNGNGKQTLALPWDCADGFNEVMKNHHLENTIQAVDMGFWGVSKYEKIIKIKEQVDKGLPVTLYTALAGDGELGNHYVNVYGYEDWIGKDQNGRDITHTMLQFRMNWGDRYNKPLYMDSNILDSFITGIIYYDVVYKYQSLPAMLFQGFKNEHNQGQYFNEVIEHPLSIINPEETINFMTRRLRCSYINQGYFVLSANRDNHDTAYLELEFEEDVRQVGLNLNLWSHKERFSSDTSLRLEYFDKTENVWKIGREINALLLPLKEEVSKTNLTLLPKDVNKIRIIVENKGITTDRNKGRIVIDSIDIYFDTYNQVYKPHEHSFNDHFVYDDEFYHWAYCKCGRGIQLPHILIEGNDICLGCREKAHVHNHTWKIENYNQNEHKAYCECGNYILEEHSYTYLCEPIDEGKHQLKCMCGSVHIESHDIGEINVGHCTRNCQYCGADVLILHIFKDHYEPYDENEHLAYCICGDVILKEHTYNEDEICIYCENHNQVE